MRVLSIADSRSTLILEDDNEERVPEFRRVLPDATIVRNPLIAIDALNGREFSTVMLDFNVPSPDLECGLNVAQWLAEQKFTGLVVIHSSNRFGASLMADVLTKAGVQNIREEFGNFLVER